MVTPAARREFVDHLQTEHEVSQRRACAALDIDRSSIRYRSRRPDDSGVRERIRKLASQRRRFGYRRLNFLLTGEGSYMNQKRFRRLYREEGLQVQSLDNCNADEPLAAFTNRQMAACRSTKDNLREAKIVPDVTLK